MAKSILKNIKPSLVSYLEKNKLDHANSQSGYTYYIQNLYLSLYKENRYE